MLGEGSRPHLLRVGRVRGTLGFSRAREGLGEPRGEVAEKRFQGQGAGTHDGNVALDNTIRGE